MTWFPPEYAYLLAGVPEEEMIVKVKTTARCAGCGQFLSLKTEDGAFLRMNNLYSHMTETCITKVHDKLKEKYPSFELAVDKEYPE